MTHKQGAGGGVDTVTTGCGRRAAGLAFLALTLCAGHALAWGSGHATQARLVLAALPAEIRDFFPEAVQRQIIQEYCMYPDRARSFDEALLGRAAVEELARVQKLTSGRLLHDDISIALVFDLLTQAFADGNPQQAAVWLGSLIHTIGDDGSHLPLTAYTRALSQFKIESAKSHGDLSEIEETALGRETAAQLMAVFTPEAMPGEPDEVLTALILLAYQEMEYGAQRQSRITGMRNADDPAVREDGIRALAELGAEGARRTVKAAVTAWAFAAQKREFSLTEPLIAQARQKAKAYCNAKPLAHDAVYDGTLDSKPAGPAVGVVLDPSTFMGNRRFSYSGSVTLAQIMRTLRDAGVPYLPLDIRTVEREGLPPATVVPAVVVVAGGFNTDPAPFRAYVEGGGRLLWIGGRDKGLLGKLSAALKPVDPSLVPVSLKYNDPNTAVVARVSITFANEWSHELGTAPRRFVNNPNMGDWVQPKCEFQVTTDDPAIRVLASVTDGTGTMHLAGAWMEDGRARHLAMPEYLLVPCVLSNEKKVDFANLTLDTVGRPILLSAIQLLVPELGALATP